jgi:hypothetical protein
MKDVCQEIREQIPLYIDCQLPVRQAQVVSEHLRQCKQCSDYLQSIKKDDTLLNDFVESMRPSIERIEKEVIAAVEHQPQRRATDFAAWISNNGRILRYVAAAAVLIIAGFLTGRVSTARVDVERLRNDIKGSLAQELKKELSEQLMNNVQTAFAAQLAQAKDELRREYQTQLNDFALQTVAASSAVSNRLIGEFTDAIYQSRIEELNRVAFAINQVAAVNARLRDEFTTFASYAGGQLFETRQKVNELAYRTGPGAYEPFNNHNNLQ